MTKTASPAAKVSVIMPIYKHERLQMAIESILGQSMSDFELILINDGSPYSQVGDVARQYAKQDSRVCLFEQENAGVAVARNKGAQHAKAPVLMWMDDDDISLPNRMREQYDFLLENPEVAAVNCGYAFIEGGKATEKTVLLFDKIIVQRKPQSALDHLPIINGPMVMLKKEAFEAAGGFRKNFAAAEDADFGYRIEERHAVAYMPNVLYHYCIDGAGLSKNRALPVYSYAARLSATLRRAGEADFIHEGIKFDDIVAQLCRLPKKHRHQCIRQLRKYDGEGFGGYRRHFPDDKFYFLMQAAKLHIKKRLR